MRLRVGALLLAILAVVAAPTFAQSVTGGVKVGVNFNQLTLEEDTQEFKSAFKPGLLIGVTVDVPITGQFSFAPEFLYAMRNGKGGDDFGDTDDGFKVKLGFVEIPILFKASFTGGSASPFVVFGPGIGFVASAKAEEGGIEEDIKDDVEKVSFTGIVGVGVKFGRGTIEVRYDHGFTDLDKEDGSEARFRSFSVLVGFGFGG